jgi:hypothetical protein
VDRTSDSLFAGSGRAQDDYRNISAGRAPNRSKRDFDGMTAEQARSDRLKGARSIDAFDEHTEVIADAEHATRRNWGVLDALSVQISAIRTAQILNRKDRTLAMEFGVPP